MNTAAGYNTAGVAMGSSASGATAYRMFVVGAAADGVKHSVGAPTAGGTVDGVGGASPAGTAVIFACPGFPMLVEAGGAFSANDLLQTDSVGRAVFRTSGTIVMRALEAASGAGVVVQAVFAR